MRRWLCAVFTAALGAVSRFQLTARSVPGDLVTRVACSRPPLKLFAWCLEAGLYEHDDVLAIPVLRTFISSAGAPSSRFDSTAQAQRPRSPPFPTTRPRCHVDRSRGDGGDNRRGRDTAGVNSAPPRLCGGCEDATADTQGTSNGLLPYPGRPADYRKCWNAE